MESNKNLEAAYQFCQKLSHRHYENFPVASFLLPKEMRRPISVIYSFARTADDFADEGNEDQKTRLRQLDDYSTSLKQIRQQHYQGNNPIFIALTDVIQNYKLPIQLFDDLLSAFKQDVVKKYYTNFDEVLDYCKHSANPVGRLLLHLNSKPDNEQLQQSDAICTALQLINFYQDVNQDYTEQNRIYLPQDEMENAGIKERQLAGKQDTTTLEPLLRRQYKRAKNILISGSKLGNSLNGRFGWEIRTIVLGGAMILNKLEQQSGPVMLSRPRLAYSDLIRLLINSASKKRYISTLDKLVN